MVIFWLVVSTPLKNISQIASASQLLGKIKNVPNHQPVFKSYGTNYQRVTEMIDGVSTCPICNLLALINQCTYQSLSLLLLRSD